MKRSEFSDEQILAIVKDGEAGRKCQISVGRTGSPSRRASGRTLHSEPTRRAHRLEGTMADSQRVDEVAGDNADVVAMTPRDLGDRNASVHPRQ
jgi:hypothetical protein